MQGYLPPRGLIAELITPLNRDLTLDHQVLINHLSNLKPFVNAVMILSPEAGEGFAIPIEAKKELIGTCAEVIKGELPLFVFVTSDTKEETIKNISTFDELLNGLSYKGDIFWVDAPLYYHSNRGLPDFYKKITNSISYPLIIYNNPKIVEKVKGPFNRRNMRTSILKELSLIEGIKGLIFIGDLKRALNYQKAVEERLYFRIYDGDEELFINFPNKNGLLSISANLIPHIWKRILDMDSQRDIKNIWHTLKEFLTLTKKGGPVLVKKILYRKGVLDSYFCSTNQSIDETLLEEAYNLLCELRDFYEKYM